MKKQRKQFIVIVLLLFAAAILLLILRISNDKKTKAEAESKEAAVIHVTDCSTEDVNAFTYIYNGETIEFVKEEDVWYSSADRTLSIDQDAVDTMLSSVCELTAEQEVTDYEDLSQYGLDAPSNTITLTTDDGTTTLYVGSKNSMLSQYYVMKEGSESLYLVDEAVSTSFMKTAADLVAADDTETETTETTETEAIDTTELAE